MYIIIYNVYILYILTIKSSWHWASRLVLFPQYWEWGSNKHGSVSFSAVEDSILQENASAWDNWVIWQFCF